MPRQPVTFLAHGAPPLLDDARWCAELQAWGLSLRARRPTALLVISAHWEARPVAVGPTRAAPLTYDFYGFPEKYYRLTYPSPAAPALARQVVALAAAAGVPVVEEAGRGLDHGAWVPLIPMFPDADIPVLQLSLPTLEPKPLLRLGQLLAPLRDEGVLIMGSGFLTHNLRALSWDPRAPVPSWASEFDTWIADVLARSDLDALADFANKAPGARLAHPRTEHLVPVMVSAGAAAGERARFPISGFAFGSFSKRSLEIG